MKLLTIISVKQHIYGTDEIGVTSDQKLQSIVAMKENKQIGSVISDGHGQLVKLYAAVCSIVTFASPILSGKLNLKILFVRRQREHNYNTII